MKSPFSWSFGFIVLALILAGAGVFLSQAQQTVLLRSELESTRGDVVEMERLRVANQRLKEKQIAPAELEALRADHVEVVRLRGEVEALNRRASGARP